jgi:hypothetical protein
MPPPDPRCQSRARIRQFIAGRMGVRRCGLRARGSPARNEATGRKPRPVIVSSLRAQAADLVTVAIAIVSRSLPSFRRKGILHDIIGNGNSKRGSVGCCGSKVDAAEYARILYIFESF